MLKIPWRFDSSYFPAFWTLSIYLLLPVIAFIVRLLKFYCSHVKSLHKITEMMKCVHYRDYRAKTRQKYRYNDTENNLRGSSGLSRSVQIFVSKRIIIPVWTTSQKLVENDVSIFAKCLPLVGGRLSTATRWIIIFNSCNFIILDSLKSFWFISFPTSKLPFMFSTNFIISGTKIWDYLLEFGFGTEFTIQTRPYASSNRNKWKTKLVG